MNENERINNLQITIIWCVGAKTQDGEMCWILIAKTKMGIIFNLQNSHELTWSLQTEKSLGTQPKLACGQSSSCCFSFSATRNAITKGNKYLTFGFSFVEGELFVSSWLAISNTGKNFLSYKLWCHTTISSPENSHNNTVKKYCIFSHAFTIVNPRLFVWIFLDHGC